MGAMVEQEFIRVQYRGDKTSGISIADASHMGFVQNGPHAGHTIKYARFGEYNSINCSCGAMWTDIPQLDLYADPNPPLRNLDTSLIPVLKGLFNHPSLRNSPYKWVASFSNKSPFPHVPKADIRFPNFSGIEIETHSYEETLFTWDGYMIARIDEWEDLFKGLVVTSREIHISPDTITPYYGWAFSHQYINQNDRIWKVYVHVSGAEYRESDK